MDVTISGRGNTVPEPVRTHAEAKLRRLQRFHPGVQTGNVRFMLESGIRRVEADVKIAGAGSVAASGTGPTFRAAFELACNRLRRQLRRRRERARDRSASIRSETLPPIAGT